MTPQWFHFIPHAQIVYLKLSVPRIFRSRQNVVTLHENCRLVAYLNHWVFTIAQIINSGQVRQQQDPIFSIKTHTWSFPNEEQPMDKEILVLDPSKSFGLNTQEFAKSHFLNKATLCMLYSMRLRMVKRSFASSSSSQQSIVILMSID